MPAHMHHVHKTTIAGDVSIAESSWLWSHFLVEVAWVLLERYG